MENSNTAFTRLVLNKGIATVFAKATLLLPDGDFYVHWFDWMKSGEKQIQNLRLN